MLANLICENKMSNTIPVNIAIILSFIIFVLYIVGFQSIFTNYQKNDCEMTFMFEYPQFVEISLPPEVQKAYPKYTLYGYGEGRITENLRRMNFKGIPVLFIPGSSGSYKQGRSLASVSLRKSLNSRTPFHFNYFMIDFIEEQSALFGGVLKDQTKFVLHSVQKILSLYRKNEEHKVPDSVILIAHSMGGLLAKGVFMDPEFDPKSVRLVISLATPHKYPLFQPDNYITSYYKDVNSFWSKNLNVNQTFFISIGGGPKDLLVHSDVTSDPLSDLNVLTTAVPGVWLSNDHLSIMWCKQFVISIIRALFDVIDISTKQLTRDKEYIKKVFEYHFLKRSGGKRFSTSQVSRFASFERSMHWYENLQRQFSVSEPKGISSNHYIMIRLFSDPRNELAFIETYNVNVKDWIYVCSADVVYNSIRMCDSGENISNLTEIAPIDGTLRLKRKFVSINLLEIKAKAFTHVIIKLPPSSSYMSVNVDIFSSKDRNISIEVPKYYSTSSKTVIEYTQENAVYYRIHLIGFEYIWQSFFLNFKILSCKSDKNHAVVSLITPWSNENQYFIYNEKASFSVPLNLISPKPKKHNTTSYPFVTLHLDPSCKYQVTLQPSIVGMFGQGARYYSVMLPAFITTVVLLTLRQQFKHLEEEKCVLFQSALSSAVRPYYVVLQASILGSKLLGLGIFLSVLPEPDFQTLQELNLDSFFLTILLYAVAIVLAYSAGAALYVSVILAGQTAQKLALRFVAKAISGAFNWSEWVIAALHQMPVFVAVFLISLSFSTTGALSLWVGFFFYFLKICKMYEDYLEDWFNYSLKFIALKIRDLVVDLFTKRKNMSNKTDENCLENKEKEVEIKNTEMETKIEDSEMKVENTNQVEEERAVGKVESNSGPETVSSENESEEDLLAAIHFHVSILSCWLLAALLYIPSLTFWVRNYHYSASLEKDPALIPSIVIIACGAILWQPGIPKPCRKLSKVTSSSLFVLAVISIVYSLLSLYRLGYIISASLCVVTVNQIVAKYF